ncbi:MAG: hypothetical protein CL946_00735 [Ectothiorhodospiraceae bacterium]|nr:hypothetical protein [Ectothiorhodospiraceae bacterium]
MAFQRIGATVKRFGKYKLCLYGDGFTERDKVEVKWVAPNGEKLISIGHIEKVVRNHAVAHLEDAKNEDTGSLPSKPTSPLGPRTDGDLVDVTVTVGNDPNAPSVTEPGVEDPNTP